MKATTADRLKEIMQRYDLRQVDILKRAEPYCMQYGVKLGRNDLSQYVSGKVSPGQEKLTILALALKVSETWLMGYDVPMERNDYEDPKLSRYDAELDEAIEILQSEGYEVLLSDKPEDDTIIIKDSEKQIVACIHEYELVGKYESLQTARVITADNLLENMKGAFLSYLASLGYRLYRDDPEHKPFIITSGTSYKLDYDTLNILKSRVDQYTKATVDSELLKLREEELRLERIQNERIAKQLLENAKATRTPSSVLVAAHNDHADDPEEQEKIRRDLELLKKIDEQNR